MQTTKIAALVGSLRTKSYNRLSLEAVGQLLPPGVDLEEIDLATIAFYNADVEAAGDPDGVANMKALVAESDLLIIFSPEYNGSMPGVVKNAIDWLSSSTEGPSILSEAAVALVVTIPGKHQAVGVQDHLGTCIGANTKEPLRGIHVINSARHRLTDESGIPDTDGLVLGGSKLGDMDPLPDLQRWLTTLLTGPAS